MSTLNYIRRLWSSSVRSRARWSKSGTGSLVCATIVAGLALGGGIAKADFTPYNVLVNPGAETADLTGWTTAAAVGYVNVVSTNDTMAAVTNGIISTNKLLAHSGAHTFQMFNTTGPGQGTVQIYQDFAAASNSQWSASCWAICYASNYLSLTADQNSHLQVVFYDAASNVVLYPGGSGGTFGSDFIDPIDYNTLFGDVYVRVPPMATDPSGWFYLQVTNLYDTDPATEASWDLGKQPASSTLTAPPGTARVRYLLEFVNPATDGGSVYYDDCVLTKLNLTDPDITNGPVAVTTYVASSASFSVIAAHTGAYPNEKLTYQWEYNGTPLPPAGGVNDIVGSTTTATLSFSNCHTNDSGVYDCVVTLKSAGNYTNSMHSLTVPLTVLALSPLQKANILGPNGGFENNPNWAPFLPFNGCYWAANIVYDGNWSALIGGNGDRDNGFDQAFGTGSKCIVVPSVKPGSVWKAGGWAYISSTNDFPASAANTCRLQIWFRDANGNGLSDNPPYTPTFESFKIYGWAYTNSDMQYTNIDRSSPYYGQKMYHDMLPRDTWFYLPVSNVVNNAGIGLQDDLPVGTWNGGYFIVPTNSEIAQINFQVYEYCPVSGDNPQPPYLGSGTGGVYWDDMELIQVLPVTNLTASASVSDNHFNLSFAAGAGLNYAVLYKTNLNDAAWNLLTTVAAPMSWQTNITVTTTTYPLTVSDTLSAQSRFYRIQSQ